MLREKLTECLQM